MEIGTEAAQFPFWEYIKGNFFAVQPCVVVVVQIKLPLCQVDLAQVVNEWKDVESNKEDDQYLGDICFSLRYVPTSGKVSALSYAKVFRSSMLLELCQQRWGGGGGDSQPGGGAVAEFKDLYGES